MSMADASPFPTCRGSERVAPTFTPHSESEIADIVRAGRTLAIRGQDTKPGLGRPAIADAVLDLSALTGIVRYEPDELVITARAGTTVAEIEAALAERHQRLGFDPADWSALYGSAGGRGTIGGALGADTSGPARLRYGAARDHLLGFRAVNGDGEAYRAGAHVVKNVTGFDLPKLVCGALGTLGPLTEVTLRLVPRAPGTATLMVRDVAPTEGLALLRRVWASPLEPTGLAYRPDEGGGAILRVDGAAVPLADKIAALRTLLRGHDVQTLPDGDAVFAAIGSGAAFAACDAPVWRVFVAPGAAAALVESLSPSRWLADWAGGVLWIAGHAEVRAAAHRAGGHARLMRADDETRAALGYLPPEDVARAALTRRVKQAFDPRGLFNPGRLFEGV